MDVIEAILTRRSIRKYTGEPISQQELETVLRAACYAPSAHNFQPWEFIIIKDKGKFEKIANMHPYAKMLPQADVCIIVCGDNGKQPMMGYLVEDCSASIQNILLAAHGIGLGAVWCGLYPQEDRVKFIKELCKLPDNIIPVGMVVMGHKGEDRKVEDRFKPEKLHYENW